MASRRKIRRDGQIAEQAFRRLMEAILSGELPSGQPVPEIRLAQEWNVGRTPLREATRRAAESGFIVLRPNHRPLVRWLTPQEIRDLYELRRVLEMFALERAWGDVTPEQIQSLHKLAAKAAPGKARDWVKLCLEFDLALHALWTQGCGNSWLIKDLERHYRFLCIFQLWIGRDPQAVAMAYQEHLGILQAIEARDKAKALALLSDHISASAKMVVRALPHTQDANQPPVAQTTSQSASA